MSTFNTQEWRNYLIFYNRCHLCYEYDSVMSDWQMNLKAKTQQNSTFVFLEIFKIFKDTIAFAQYNMCTFGYSQNKVKVMITQQDVLYNSAFLIICGIRWEVMAWTLWPKISLSFLSQRKGNEYTSFFWAVFSLPRLVSNCSSSSCCYFTRQRQQTSPCIGSWWQLFCWTCSSSLPLGSHLTLSSMESFTWQSWRLREILSPMRGWKETTFVGSQTKPTPSSIRMHS